MVGTWMRNDSHLESFALPHGMAAKEAAPVVVLDAGVEMPLEDTQQCSTLTIQNREEQNFECLQ